MLLLDALAPPIAEALPPAPSGPKRFLPVPLLRQLRELGAEVRDLQTLLEGMRKGETTPKVYADYIQKTKQDIDALIKGIFFCFLKEFCMPI